MLLRNGIEHAPRLMLKVFADRGIREDYLKAEGRKCWDCLKHLEKQTKRL